jgi:hypothetical protein
VKPGTNFVGRDRELDRLDAVLSDPGQVVVQAVHGLGGIGKTTLVAHWAATRPHGLSPVRWITADTTASVEQGLAKFAAALQPALAQVLEVEQLADRALQWLATHSGWLLILDNVSEPADIAEVLARAGTGRIVITSRLALGWQQATTFVRLDVMNPDESLQLLTGIFTAAGPRDCDGATELCEALGHLPLAIEQAGAYLAQNCFTTPRAYLQLLTDYPADMYDQAAIGTDSERTIARIWRVSLDRITTAQPIAADLLRTLAWYGPDAIPLRLCRSIASPPVVDAALGVLTAYSMITPHSGTSSVSLHRLVQGVARTPIPQTHIAALKRSNVPTPALPHSCTTRFPTEKTPVPGRPGELYYPTSKRWSNTPTPTLPPPRQSSTPPHFSLRTRVWTHSRSLTFTAPSPTMSASSPPPIRTPT